VGEGMGEKVNQVINQESKSKNRRLRWSGCA